MRYLLVLLLPAILSPADARNPRPVPQGGPVQVINSTHTRVHYVTAGQDSTTTALAQFIAAAAETIWVRVSAAGWYPPAPDYGAGGDDRLDFYIVQLPPPAVGMNIPDTAYTSPYPDGVCCYDVYDPNLTVNDFLRAVVFHEFEHACQGRCDNYVGGGGWLYECSSIYMTEVFFPGWHEVFPWSFNRFSPQTMPWLSLNCVDSSYPGRGALWMRFVHEYYGADVPRRFWDLMGRHPGEYTFADFDSVLKRDFNSSLDDALGHYAIWRYFTGARDDGQHFRSAESLCACSVHVRHTTYPARGTQGVHGPRGPGGMNAIEFVLSGDRDLDISFDGQDGYRWRVYVLCIRDGVCHEQLMQLDGANSGAVRVPASLAETAVLMPVALDRGSSGYITPQLTYSYSASLADEVPKAVEERPQCEVVPRLNTSSPVSSGTAIQVSLTRGVFGRLTIADALGRQVRTFDLVGTGKMQTIQWRRDDDAGRRVSGGLYFCRLDAAADAVGIKLVVQ